MKNILLALICCLSLNAEELSHTGLKYHQEVDHSKHRGPIGIMGDHLHEKGKFMFGYYRMQMTMDHHYSGSDHISKKNILKNYMVTPRSMNMEMDMLGLMYGVSDRLTLMLMVKYIHLSMDHRNRMGRKFTTSSEGFGDTELHLIYGLWNKDCHQLLLNFGVSLPTGGVNEKDRTLMGSGQKLPYPMQLGTGTFDFIPGLTYTGHSDRWTWGAQVKARIHTGRNSQGYTQGNRLDSNLWVGYQVTSKLQITVRLQGEHWDDLEGDDDELNPAMVPTADAHLRSGERYSALLGIRYNFNASNSLAVEVGKPFYRHLAGAQLDKNYTFKAGWQFSF